MKSTVEWLDAAKAAQGLTSDYQLAQRWQVSRATISKYRSRREFLSEEMAAKVAADTGADLQLVLACAAGERARMPAARDAWERLAKQLGGAAAAVAVALLVTEPLFLESGLIYAADNVQALALCIMSNGAIAIFLFVINLLPFLAHEQQ